MPTLPHFRTDADAMRLIVDGEPFLILGGELGNSAASHEAALAPCWAMCVDLHLNTLLAPVYWELVEPEEGRFDFASLDPLISSARAHGLRLVLLWFGAWKNSMSTYAPAWAKRDAARFPHARDASGRPVEIFSALDDALLAADVAAYAAMLRHVRDVDSGGRTVLMVQVENEIGFLPDPREHGPRADAAWAGPVPAALTAYLTARRDTLAPELRVTWERNGARASGTWSQVFGDHAAGEEVFQAWQYARFVDSLSVAGKREHALPTYVNAALNRPGWKPGRYPSGGPLPHLLDVWRAGAPSVDMLSPDIYFYDFPAWTARYVRPGNPLFVPEATRASRASANAFTAVVGQRAIGFSPFGIESASGVDAEMLAATYAALRDLAPRILTPGATMFALTPRVNHDGTVSPDAQTITVGPYRLTIAFDGVADQNATFTSVGGDPAMRGSALRASGGMILFDGPDAYRIVGTGLTVVHEFVEGDDRVGLLDVDEWRVDASGTWSMHRRMNGDQTHQGRHVRLNPGRIAMQHVRLYRVA